jgi:hypothetical protein
MVMGIGYRVEGIGYRVEGIGYRVEGIGYRVEGIGYRQRGQGRGYASVGTFRQPTAKGGQHSTDFVDSLENPDSTGCMLFCHTSKSRCD